MRPTGITHTGLTGIRVTSTPSCRIPAKGGAGVDGSEQGGRMFLFQLVPVMAGVRDILYAIIVKKQAEIRGKEKPRKRLNLRGLGRTGRDF